MEKCFFWPLEMKPLTSVSALNIVTSDFIVYCFLVSDSQKNNFFERFVKIARINHEQERIQVESIIEALWR